MERDLGIWVSNDLKWETQCKKTAELAMSVLSMIRRIFPVDYVEEFKWLYNVYIRPHLKFCVSSLVAVFQKIY